MYEHWIEDENQKYEQRRTQAILTGSFSNPEMARKMIKDQNPDFASNEKDFEKSLEMVKNQKTEEENKPRRRRRKLNKV